MLLHRRGEGVDIWVCVSEEIEGKGDADIELGGDIDRWGGVGEGRPYVIEVTLEVPGNLSELISVADELSVI